MPAPVNGGFQRGARVILAGIDEAGYGPRLGPLVVAASAFRSACSAARHDAWPQCRFLCGPGPLVVGDSKSLYPAGGMAALESVVLGFAASRSSRPVDLAEFLEMFAAEGAGSARSLPWYSWRNPALPRSVAPCVVEISARQASEALRGASLEYLWTRVCVVDEARYNQLLLRIGNKAMLLFGRNALLMRRLWDELGADGVYLTVDRHGGRKFYAGLLDIVFPDAGIAVLRETDDESAYRLEGRDGRCMFVRFVVRAEGVDSSVALSSMWAKYVRELFMGLFNDYWLSRAGSVKPTAGYWVDGERFVADLRAAGVVSDADAQRLIRWK